MNNLATLVCNAAFSPFISLTSFDGRKKINFVNFRSSKRRFVVHHFRSVFVFWMLLGTYLHVYGRHSSHSKEVSVEKSQGSNVKKHLLWTLLCFMNFVREKTKTFLCISDGTLSNTDEILRNSTFKGSKRERIDIFNGIQGCQMVHRSIFKPKSPNWGKLWRVLQWKC
jgi:hypothetical protein